MNNYSIPMELATARQQREDAWKKYNDLIDAGKTETANNFFPMVQMFEENASRLYVEWMTKGGTSDIQTLALHNIDHTWITNAVSTCVDVYVTHIRRDPRTGEQADLDRWQDEVEATRKTDRPY